jgi:hypothetical protein
MLRTLKILSIPMKSTWSVMPEKDGMIFLNGAREWMKQQFTAIAALGMGG